MRTCAIIHPLHLELETARALRKVSSRVPRPIGSMRDSLRGSVRHIIPPPGTRRCRSSASCRHWWPEATR